MTAIGFLQPGPVEIIVILFIILLLFGAKKLPGLARSLGKSLQEFKRGKDEVMRELTAAQEEDSKPYSSPHAEDELEEEDIYDEDIEMEDEDIEDEEMEQPEEPKAQKENKKTSGDKE